MQFDTSGIPESIVQLWRVADERWEYKIDDPDFESYASADYAAVYHSLKALSNSANTFLEFGSGLGVVTIMASHLGFDAYGIEAKESLVDIAEEYAKKYAPESKFAVGSFIPDEFHWDPSAGHESVRTFVDVPSAYRELDLQLSDFDLIYAYPWPTEHELYDQVVDSFARSGAKYLTYDAREGIELRQLN